jgi:hypothetical protein
MVDELMVGGFDFTGTDARDLRVFSGDVMLSGTDIAKEKGTR